MNRTTKDTCQHQEWEATFLLCGVPHKQMRFQRRQGKRKERGESSRRRETQSDNLIKGTWKEEGRWDQYVQLRERVREKSLHAFKKEAETHKWTMTRLTKITQEARGGCVCVCMYVCVYVCVCMCVYVCVCSQ